MSDDWMRPPRWRAIVWYRHDSGPVGVVYDIEELEEFPALVELGPHWDTVLRIEIRLQRPAQPEIPELTVEQARQL